MSGTYLTRQVWGNTAALLVPTLVTMGSQALLFYFMARIWGPQDYGIVTLAFTLLSLAMTVTLLGSDTFGMRWIAQGQAAAGEVPDYLLTFRLLNAGALVLGLGIVLLAGAGGVRERTFIGIMLVSLLPDAITTVVGTSLYGRERFHLYAALTTAAALAGLVLGGAALWLGASLFTVGAILVALKAGVALAAWELHRRMVGPLRLVAPGLAYRNLLRPSLPYFLTTILAVLHMKVDIPLVRIMLGTGELGLYGLAATVANAAAVIFLQPLSASLFPAVARAGGATSTLHPRRALRTLLLPLVAGLLGGGGLCLCAGPLLGMALGPAYEGSVAPLRILAWFLPPIFVSSTASRMLMACGHTGVIIRILLVNVAVNITANLVLIPWLGIRGAAWATVLSAAVSALQSVLVLARLPQVPDGASGLTR